ncbi:MULTISPECIES: DUF881 domain-containing protein [Janibacter]|uniref:DUF881 domain-containing protein n=2 Tax=Intrasporangiaceae TaxID=85021 RepID=UPI0002E38ED5|nr:DUF881 domain-containing protein [Janibacter hoylei]MCT1619751.1 DUF881 domain-containing protein [Janibacter hoylei]MCT2293536.1 DUF881 domain-containing protein [Janibacter hoylei]
MRPDLPDEAPETRVDSDDLGEGEDEYADASGVAHPPPRRDASMTLLTSMLERPLDPGYQAAADRRVARGLPASAGSRRWVLFSWLLVIGLVVGISTAELRGRDGARAAARADLIRQIEDRQASVETRDTRARALQQEVDTATAQLDPDLVGTQREELDALRVESGLAAVQGPGLRITLDDAPGAQRSADGDPRTGTDAEGRVQSRDMQIITNGLWASGAEAITVNGQRLTSRTAIRFAGEAILVNFRPLTRPYTIEAIGDPTQMQTRFAEGSAGSYLTGLRNNYGIQTSLTAQQELDLPSAVNVSTRLADVIPRGGTVPEETPLKKETK